MFKSPNSVVNKARTQLLNKQRMLSEVGHLLMKDHGWLIDAVVWFGLLMHLNYIYDVI